MFASLSLWVNRRYHRRSHHHRLLLFDANYIFSLLPLVIDLLRFIRLVELASVVVFGVIMFPLIGCDFPVCTSHITAALFPSTSEVGDVFPVMEISSINLQYIGFCLLALRLNGYYRFQSVMRVLKQPWPPPGLFSTDLLYSVAILRKGWATGSLDKENKGKLHDVIFAVKERSSRDIMTTHEDSTRTSLVSLGNEVSKAIRRQMLLWLYWFQSKRISMPWIITMKHVISCSGSVWGGLRCNGWIESNDLFRENRHLLTRTESHQKDQQRPRTKWRKTSESACPTNALGSIVLLLSLLKVLFNNMFNVIYNSCNMLH